MASLVSGLISRLRRFVETQFKIAVLTVFLSAFLLRMAILLSVAAYRPELLSFSVIGYIVENTSGRTWNVDFAYPPLIYILYRTMATMTTNPVLLRLPIVCSSLLGGLVLLKVANRYLDSFKSFIVVSAFLFNPVLIFTELGDFDSLPILLTICAAYFALKRRPLLSALFLAIGFDLKWFPILLVPVFYRWLKRDDSLLRLSSFASFPLILWFSSLFLIQALWSIGPSQVSNTSASFFQGRVPVGFSIWWLAEIIIGNATVISLSLASYALQIIVFIFGVFALHTTSEIQFIKQSFVILFSVVMLSIQLFPNYLLWFSPFLLILVFKAPQSRRLYQLFSLTILTYLIPLIYMALNTWRSISDQRYFGPVWLNPTSSAIDIALFLGSQLFAWTLISFIVWTKNSA